MSVSSTEAPQVLSGPRARPPFTEDGPLRLFVERDPFFSNLRDCFIAMSRPMPRGVPVRVPFFLRREISGPRRRYAGRSLSLSLALHCIVVATMLYLPSLVPDDLPLQQGQSEFTQTIYYRIPLKKLANTPRSTAVNPKRVAAPHRDRSSIPKLQNPPRKSLASIISRPSHPDNFQQTIYQSASPPDLNIKAEQKLPNIVVLQQNQQMVKASFGPSYARPAPIERKSFAGPAPVVIASNSPDSMGAVLHLSGSDPHLIIPEAGGGSPTVRKPAIAAGPLSQAPDLVAISENPAEPTKLLSLPNGNRWGEFSIARPTEPSGSRDGVTGPARTKSAGGDAVAANDSSGISRESSAAGPINIIGTNRATPAMLLSSLPASLVYPVVQPLNAIRRNTMVISTGPIGGGGLNVYGALNCGKIYSVFLPMPGKNWSLQYCDKSLIHNPSPASGRVQVLRLEKPLVPPDVDLNHRYDFKRIAVPAQNENRPIILKGVIAADGTVQRLVVYRGVSAELDEAARLAFSRWHFKPAMRQGKPVAVEILVGIPPVSGDDHLNR